MALEDAPPIGQNPGDVQPVTTSRCESDHCLILVVDDDDDLREGLAEILEDEGLGVATASNGREALVYLRSHEAPAVILLDLMMPVMNGPELRAILLEDTSLSSIPVILLTAAHDGRAQAARLGAAGYFSKPIRFEKLLEAVREHC